MSNQHTTDIEQWKEIGEQTAQTQEQLNKYFNAITTSLPDSVGREQIEQIDAACSALDIVLAERLEEEHPSECPSDIFPESDERPTSDEESVIRELAHELLGEEATVHSSSHRALYVMVEGAPSSAIDHLRSELREMGYATSRPVNRLLKITPSNFDLS